MVLFHIRLRSLLLRLPMPYKDPEKRRLYHLRYNRTYRITHHQQLLRDKRKYNRIHHKELSTLHHLRYAIDPEPFIKTQQTYNAKHPDRQKKYYETNKEKILTRNKTHHLVNKDKRNLHSRSYHAAHPEKKKAYNTTHKEERSQYNQKRRALKNKAPLNDLTAAQWRIIQETFDHRCAYCHRRARGHLTQDHLTPMSLGGSHTVHNVVPACISCNASKQAGPPPVPVQPLLLTLAAPR